MTQDIRVAAIGECMVELQEKPDGGITQSFGGDTFNTAAYMARLGEGLGSFVDYVSAIGDDPFSEDMAAFWRAQGVGDGLVLRPSGTSARALFHQDRRHRRAPLLLLAWRSRRPRSLRGGRFRRDPRRPRQLQQHLPLGNQSGGAEAAKPHPADRPSRGTGPRRCRHRFRLQLSAAPLGKRRDHARHLRRGHRLCAPRHGHRGRT